MFSKKINCPFKQCLITAMCIKCISQLRLSFTELIRISQRFVQGVLSYYYKNDAEVQQDSELQKWILDIFEHGFLFQACTGELQRKAQS